MHDFFGLKLDHARSKIGVDGTAVDGRTVQVKATGTKRGPAFRPTKVGADHLLFFCIDFENGTAEVVFNGPEEIAIGDLFSNPNATTQRMVTRKQIVSRNSDVNENDKLPQLKPKFSKSKMTARSPRLRVAPVRLDEREPLCHPRGYRS